MNNAEFFYLQSKIVESAFQKPSVDCLLYHLFHTNIIQKPKRRLKKKKKEKNYYYFLLDSSRCWNNVCFGISILSFESTSNNQISP
jgi:hypothetical protein